MGRLQFSSDYHSTACFRLYRAVRDRLFPTPCRLNVSYHQLNGTMPSSIGNLTQLNMLCARTRIRAYHGRTASVRWFVSGCVSRKRLQRRYLNNNQLNGTIPNSIGQLTGLQYLCAPVLIRSRIYACLALHALANSGHVGFRERGCNAGT